MTNKSIGSSKKKTSRSYCKKDDQRREKKTWQRVGNIIQLNVYKNNNDSGIA